MNAEAQRIACAELCGWTVFSLTNANHIEGHRVITMDTVPDYLKDWNTRPELLRVIEERGLRTKFGSLILEVVGHPQPSMARGYDIWIGASLTQSQFVECVLRAAGRWEDGE